MYPPIETATNIIFVKTALSLTPFNVYPPLQNCVKITLI